MTKQYNKYYQTEHLFGSPYQKLIAFFSGYRNKGKVIDLGCGQGRDAIALARMGYTVTGIDSSEVGIKQMNHIATEENLKLTGQVGDIYAFNQFNAFDIVLLDSMFHFARKDKEKEVGLIKKIVSEINPGCLIVVCIQDTGKKVEILNKALDFEKPLNRLADEQFSYFYEDKASGHTAEMNYRMIIVEK